jgi:large subunit ribosomal protein L29
MTRVRDIRQWTDEELRAQLDQARRELFNLRFQQSVGHLENPARVRQLRRDIARMLTIQRERRRATS